MGLREFESRLEAILRQIEKTSRLPRAPVKAMLHYSPTMCAWSTCATTHFAPNRRKDCYTTAPPCVLGAC